MSEERYIWDDDFNSFFELNQDNDYENLSKVTVARTLNKQDKHIKDLERQLAEAERRIDVMDCYICDEDRPRIKRELKEQG